ncbi:MAG TPA: hypothetical protein VGK00_15210 [Anaerolineales bacterium]
MNRLLLSALLFISACAPIQKATTTTPQVISLHTSPATQPWLAKAYTCAEGLGLVLSNVNDQKNADISIQLGEPDSLTSPAYQIDKEDLLVVTNHESPLENLTKEETRNLFTHPDFQAVEVWVFAPGEDIQQVFSRETLGGQVVTSLARVALNPQQMVTTLGNDKKRAGLLPRHLLNASLHEIFSIPGIPVLAIVKTEPQGLTREMLACLQK